jgi:hypothetical protein
MPAGHHVTARLTALAATGILAVATLAQAATVAAATTADAVFDLASLRAALRERLRDPALVPDGRRAFVVTDPAVIEPALDRALRFIDLTPPLSAATRERAERSAITYYRLALGEGAGLRALQTRIAAAFAQPEAAVERIANQPGLVVTLDLGWLPGPLSYTSGQGYHIERTTDVFDGYAPSTRLIAGKLADAQMRWPDATQIRLHVRHPYYGRVADYRIVYTLRDGRGATIGSVRTDATRAVGVVSPMVANVENGDLSPYLNGQRSLFVRCEPKSISRGRYNVTPGDTGRTHECKGTWPDTAMDTAP